MKFVPIKYPMNSIQLLYQIQETIDELNIINNRLIKSNEIPSLLEKELMRSKCIQLFDLISKTNITHSEPEKEFEEKQKPVSMEEFEIKEAVVISNEKILPVKEHKAVEEETKIEEKVTPVIKNESFKFTESVKDPLIAIQHSEISLHEKISGSKQTDLKERINDSKVESLKSAINLNKKIAFVNDLFKENTVEYAKAIEKLNTSVNLDEAMRYFNELKHEYNWEDSNELVVELEQIIQKRYR